MTQRIMLVVFGVLAIAFSIFIFRLNNSTQKDTIDNLVLNSSIIEIYNGYKGKPNYKIALLKDSTRFVLEKEMIGELQIGDSVAKKKRENFYIVIDNKKIIKKYFIK